MVARFVSAGQRVVVAADRGLPLVLADPHGSAQITRDIAALAARIMGAGSPEFEAKPETAPRRSWKLS